MNSSAEPRDLVTITVSIAVEVPRWQADYGYATRQEAIADARGTLHDEIANAIKPLGVSVLWPGDA